MLVNPREWYLIQLASPTCCVVPKGMPLFVCYCSRFYLVGTPLPYTMALLGRKELSVKD